ncbi:MAG: glycosyltransferase family 39 protein [Acidobacteria bacterium]|nr:glycosyltransferase family 39 protein [Acidobacteriota bacterium]
MTQALPPRSAAVLLALVAALLVLRLGVVPLLGPDEPRYTRVAVEMHRAGEWVTPTLQGEPWLEKPPLFYWLAGGAFSLLGETETAARLPSVLATLLLVGVTMFVGARLYGTAAGLHAGFVAGTSVLMFAYGRAASMDMLLAATVTAAIGLGGLRVLGMAGPHALPAAAAFAGLATLAKGPLGLLLPLLVLGGLVLATRQWRVAREAVSPLAVGAFVVVAAPWYVAILVDQGRQFIDVFVLNHNLQRFTSTIHHHPGPLWYYLPILLAGLFPWSGLAVPGLAGLRPRGSRSDLFALLWLGLPLLLFSLAGSKLPGYILPCVPPLAILMGRAADRLVSAAAPERYLSGRVTALVGLVLGALVATTPAFLLFRMHEPLWRSAVPFALWALAVTFLFSRRVGTDPAGALRLLRIGSAGLLLLVTLAAPPILARHESGRRLFIPTMGREVLAWGARRTAWMAGYFYNDGKVREVSGGEEVLQAAKEGPTLVIVGPGERRRLEAMGSVETRVLADGPRENVLLRVERR